MFTKDDFLLPDGSLMDAEEIALMVNSVKVEPKRSFPGLTRIPYWVPVSVNYFDESEQPIEPTSRFRDIPHLDFNIIDTLYKALGELQSMNVKCSKILLNEVAIYNLKHQSGFDLLNVNFGTNANMLLGKVILGFSNSDSLITFVFDTIEDLTRYNNIKNEAKNEKKSDVGPYISRT